MGDAVGMSLGKSEGCADDVVGPPEGITLGLSDRETLGSPVGVDVGFTVGVDVGLALGTGLGTDDGSAEGLTEGTNVG